MLEVEYYRQMAEGCLHRPIAGVAVPDPHCLLGPESPDALDAQLAGGWFETARRRGKLLLLDTAGPDGPGARHPAGGQGALRSGGRGARPGLTLGVRFGMTGSLVLDDRTAFDRLLYSPPVIDPKWIRLRIGFVDGGHLALHDPRRLGRVVVDPDEATLGPDAFGVSLGALRQALSSRRGAGPPLKVRLQDQARLAGIGNLLADEILWRAGLSPTRPSASLSALELRRLHRQLGRTLDDLLGRGGSHTGDLMEQRRAGGLCPQDGAPLERSRVGGRTTWWCPAHQR
jgi:formamidopyrimidine-DNA glycosylase